MSGYALYFWETPLPRSQDEAARIVEQLESRRCEQRPVFLELARRITARYPCSSSSDVAPDEDAWSDGPVDGRSDAPLYGLGMSTHRIAEVYPFVVEVARSLGLVTYDPEMEVVFLPSGEQFGYIAFDDLESETLDLRDECSWDRDSFYDVVQGEMESFMRENGFVRRKGERDYRRQTPSYRASICFYHDSGTYGVMAVKLFACVELKFDKAVEQRMKQKRRTIMLTFDLPKLSDARMWEAGGDSTQPYEFVNHYEIFWPAPTIGNLKSVLHQKISPFLEKALLPVLAGCASWSDLNALANPKGAEQGAFKKDGALAIIAYLVNDERKEKIAEDVKENCQDAYAKYLEMYLDMVSV